MLLVPLLLLLFVALARGDASSCVLDISFELCNSSTACAARFYQSHYTMPYAKHVFRQLLSVYLSNMPTLSLSFLCSQLIPATPPSPPLTDPLSVVLANCSEQLLGGSNNDTSAALTWWITILSLHDPCTENEIFNPDLGACECQDGKQCQEDPPGAWLFQIRTIQVGMALIVAIVLLHFAMFTREMRDLDKNFSKLFAELKTMLQRLLDNITQYAMVQAKTTSEHQQTPVAARNESQLVISAAPPPTTIRPQTIASSSLAQQQQPSPGTSVIMRPHLRPGEETGTNTATYVSSAAQSYVLPNGGRMFVATNTKQD
jgi:hypothetical protein